jgi:hypothetical protein
MQPTEAQDLVAALLSRSNAKEDARDAFAQLYPDAPLEMIDTATFHVFGDGINAAFDWLASLERFLQDPQLGIDFGATWHLLYHLYNWQQFQALLPLGKLAIAEHLKDVNLFLDEANTDAARQAIQRLIGSLSGDVEPPGIA